MSLDDDIDRLGRVPILSAMNYEALRLLAFAAESCSFPAGTAIFQKGEAAEAGYLITSGTVWLGDTPAASTGAAASPAAGRAVGPGTLLGEQALLSTAQRPVTAWAEDAVTAVKISRKLVARVLQEYPANAIAIRQAWAAKLGARMRHIKDEERP